MTDVKQILCPIDLSNISRRALDAAIALARAYDARVCALEVLDTAMPPLFFGRVDDGLLSDEMREAYAKELQTFLKGSDATGVTLDARLLDGRVVPEILREAKELPADLIVIGTHGRSGFDRLVLGSVAEKVLRKAGCPVLTVPPIGPPAVAAGAPFQTILCAVDFSVVSTQAINAAVELANRFKSTLIVLHVFDWAFGDEHMDAMPRVIIELGRSLQDQVRRQLHECVAGTRAVRPPVEVVALGRPAREIVHVAQEQAVDLIVMGIAGRGSVDLALMGSVTNRVVRDSPCPVLTVRAPVGRPLAERAVDAAAHFIM